MRFSEYLKQRDPTMYEQMLHENLLGNLWQGAKNLAGKAWSGIKGMFGMGGNQQAQAQAQPQQAQAKTQPQAQPQQAQAQPQQAQAQPQQAQAKTQPQQAKTQPQQPQQVQAKTQPQAQPQQVQAKTQPQAQPQQSTESIKNDTNIYNSVSERVKKALDKHNSTKAEADLKSVENMVNDPEIAKIANPKTKSSLMSLVKNYLDQGLSTAMNERIRAAYNNFKSTGSDQVFRDLTNLAKHEDMMKMSNEKTKDSIIKRIESYANMARTEMGAKQKMEPKKA